MPIYEYYCDSCDKEFEVIQKISDQVLTECPECQGNTLRKLTSMSAFHLKGGGWYKDGYGNGTGGTDVSPPAATAPAEKAEAKPAAKATDGNGADKTVKSEKATSEAKPATDTKSASKNTKAS